ncbi:MAG: DUF2855 family protein [Pseudomonadales bacterium]
MSEQQFLVNRNDLSDTRWQENANPPALAAGQVRLKVDQFALTANNITYAVAGDSMNYWDFFPAAAGWGQVPVWGFADVIESAHEGIAVGNRYYGYYPMATHLTVQAERVSERGFTDVVEHRAALAAVYNQYLQVPARSAAEEAAEMLYRPLFMTSFMLDDYIASNDFFGAQAVILTSASSKTSLGLAALLAQRPEITVVGLTSPGNRAFVEGLGCYAEVHLYDDAAALDATRASVIVDMAGNGTALAAVHNHLGDTLKQSILVGATHWNARAGAQTMAGPKPELFFAPSHIAARTKEWGPGGMEQRFGGAWQHFTNAVQDWIEVDARSGPEAITEVYRLQLAGKAPANRGYVLGW